MDFLVQGDFDAINRFEPCVEPAYPFTNLLPKYAFDAVLVRHQGSL